jgi:hypothetical protein
MRRIAAESGNTSGNTSGNACHLDPDSTDFALCTSFVVVTGKDFPIHSTPLVCTNLLEFCFFY